MHPCASPLVLVHRSSLTYAPLFANLHPKCSTPPAPPRIHQPSRALPRLPFWPLGTTTVQTNPFPTCSRISSPNCARGKPVLLTLSAPFPQRLVFDEEFPSKSGPLVRSTVQWLQIILHFGPLSHSECCSRWIGIDLELIYLRRSALRSSTKVVPYHRPIVPASAGVLLSHCFIRSSRAGSARVSLETRRRACERYSMSLAECAINA
jgi:hypothetical protein